MITCISQFRKHVKDKSLPTHCNTVQRAKKLEPYQNITLKPELKQDNEILQYTRN